LAKKKMRQDEELKKSQQKYRDLFENSVIGMFRSNLDGSALLDINQALCDQSGYSREELLSDSSYIHWADPGTRAEMVKQLKKFGSIVNFEADFITKNGKIKHALFSAKLYPEEGYLEGTTIDITDRKLAEEALHKASDFNEVLIQASPAFFVAISPEGKTLMMNEAMLLALGYSLDEVTGKDYLTTFVPESDREMLSEVFQTLKQAKKATFNENYILTREGKQLLVEWHGRFIYKKNDELDFFFGVGIDITERKQAEEALRESEARFRDLTENSTDWIWEVDNQMCCIYASPKIKDVLGYSPGEVIGKKTVDFLPAEEAERIPANWEDLKNNPKPWRNLEYRAIHKDGSLRVLESNALPIFDADGQFIGYRGIDRDVTKRKHTEYLLEMSKKKFAAAFYDSPAPMVITEAESGKTIDVNNAGVFWTGYSHDETIGLTGAELGFISEMERSQYIREIFDKGFIDSWELKFRTREGNIRDILLSARLIEINNKHCILSHLHDITDQRRAEEELKKYRNHLEELVKERTIDLSKTNIELKRENEVRKSTEESLRSRELELERSREELKEMNAALRVLLKQRENDKITLEDSIISNIKVSVMPYVERLDTISLKEDEKHYLSMIKSRLKEIASPFIKKLSSQFLSLTPNEIQIASMIREGKRSKDIAEIMNISLNTVHSYRYNIRIKTGLKNNKVNLRSYLQALD
jgi:PAS domain S-box-containing protein